MKKLFYAGLLLLLCVNVVYANPVETVFEAVGELNIPDLYKEYYIGIDFIIYILIFGGVLNATSSEKLGKPATVGISLAFSIAMVVFESKQGFAIGDFWYIALLALVAIVIGLIYSKVSKIDDTNKWTFISIGYIVGYILLVQTLEKIGSYFLLDYPWLHLFLQIGLIAAILKVVAAIIKILSTKKEQ
ncbi:MAG: hypothetical protein ACQESF_03380 [Nanobdellota archaeon]